MDFSSHFFPSNATVQALAEVEVSGLSPALNTLVESHAGIGSAMDSDAVSRAYEALALWSQQRNLEASLAMALESGGGLVDWVEAIAKQASSDIAGQDIAPLLSADPNEIDLLNHVNGVYTHLVDLIQPDGEQADDSLRRGGGPVLAQAVLGEMSRAAGAFTAQPEPIISVSRLLPDDDSFGAPRQADLRVSHVGVANATSLDAGAAIAPGESLMVGATFHNQGGQVAGASNIRYWLSDDLVVDATDQALGSHRLEALAPDSQSRKVVSFDYQPTWGAGQKYVLVEGDGGAQVG